MRIICPGHDMLTGPHYITIYGCKWPHRPSYDTNTPSTYESTDGCIYVCEH